MTPGARAQTAIELLDDLPDAGPADRFLSGYFRKHRFIGSKDRRAIAGLVYSVFRRRAQLDWWIVGGGARDAEPLNRTRIMAALALIENWQAPEIAQAFDGGQYRPEPLNDPEIRMVERLTAGTPSLGAPGQPAWVEYNYPVWLEQQLIASLGMDIAEEMAALMEPAAVDLRANRLKGTRDRARLLLAADDIDSEPTPLSPDGLRLSARKNLPSVKAFSEGFVEVQDEGSQVASLLVDARPGHRVVDYCAGGGGKTLAMAATMAGQGRIVACDTDEGRLNAIGGRLVGRRAYGRGCVARR